MFFIKSGRLNPDSNENDSTSFEQPLNPHFLGYSKQHKQKEYEEEFQEEQFKEQRYFNSPKIQELVQESKDFVSVQRMFKNKEKANEPIESFERKTSATSKALTSLEGDEAEKRKWKKQGKISMAMKRKKLNQRLSKLLTPKSALILLHELKPDCVFKIQEQTGCIPLSFFAQVDLNGEILGTGQGLSKSQAKNLAAENAIKTIVSRIMTRCPENRQGNGETGDEEDTPENLPWAGIASFAMYKMFNEWQNQSTELLPIPKPVVKKVKVSAVNAPTKKDLPANAKELHPAVVLNMVSPGLTAVELERNDVPISRVKMAYIIDGKVFSGVGGNKKNAKKEAAKAVLEGLYGLTYH